jgi:hypothetical protein
MAAAFLRNVGSSLHGVTTKNKNNIGLGMLLARDLFRKHTALLVGSYTANRL